MIAKLRALWKAHGTKVLGYVQAAQGVIAGFLAIQGLIPPAAVPYLAGLNVVLGAITVKRGFTNSASGA